LPHRSRVRAHAVGPEAVAAVDRCPSDAVVGGGRFLRAGQATTLEDGRLIPATKGVRLHDLRNTAATLLLTAGVHFIQVAKWLGNSSYVLTLTTYADYLPEQEVENPRPEPVAAVPDTSVVSLFG
jgi:integrase